MRTEQGLLSALALVLVAYVLPGAAPPQGLDEARAARLEQLRDEAARLHAAGRYADAERCVEQVLALRTRWLGERHWQTVDARVWLTSRQALTRLSDADRELWRRSEQRLSEATRLRQQRQYAEEEAALREALALVRKLFAENSLIVAQGHTGLGRNLQARGKFLDAQAEFEKALAIHLAHVGNQNPGTATSWVHVGTALQSLGKFARARECYERALGIYRATMGEDNLHVAALLTHATQNLLSLAKYAQAEQVASRALRIYQAKLGERSRETATSYDLLGEALRYQGKHQQAQVIVQKALDLHRSLHGDDHPMTASSYSTLASVLEDQGRIAQAQPVFERALAIYRATLGEEHPYTAIALANLALNLDNQGKRVVARQLFERALTINRKRLGDGHPQTLSVVGNLASNLHKQNLYAQAQPWFEAAFQGRRHTLGEEHPLTILCLTNLASNLSALRRLDEAEKHYDQALRLTRKLLGDDHPSTASTYMDAARNLERQGKFQEALKSYEASLRIRRKILGEEHLSTASSCQNVAATLLLLGREAEAIHLLQSSVAGMEAAHRQVAASGFDRELSRTRQATPQALLAMGLARHGQPRNAFRHLEASLARGLLDDSASTSVSEAGTMAALVVRLNRLDDQLLPLVGRQGLSPDQRGLREELTSQRHRVLRELVQAEGEASRNRVLSLEDIQAHLEEDAALVVWLNVPLYGDQQACVVRRSGPVVWQRVTGMGGKAKWTDEDSDFVHRLYLLLIDPASDARVRQGMIDQLRKHQLDPLKPHLKGVKRLLVVPTGWAAGVPIEALTTDFQVSYVPSGSVLARLRQKHRSIKSPTLLALGDPAFRLATQKPAEPPGDGVLVRAVVPGGNGERAGLRAGDVIVRLGKRTIRNLDDLKQAFAEGASPLVYWREGKEESVRLQAGQLGASLDTRPAAEAVKAWRSGQRAAGKQDEDFAPLPGTRLEVEALARLVPGATTLLGSAASEQELDRLRMEGKLEGYRLVHLATHGVVYGDRPELSALLLARDRLPEVRRQEEGKKVYSGALTVATIRAEWRLDADLVVLSACQTGLGRDTGGEGLVGFAQAFLARGARSVVLSRWKVDDLATALLMVRFYENLLGKREGLKVGMGKAAALEEARRWLRELPRAEAERLAAAYAGGELRGTVGKATPVVKGVEGVKVSVGDRPFGHEFYWAAFVVMGDPE